jgi:hypothetical protein
MKGVRPVTKAAWKELLHHGAARRATDEVAVVMSSSKVMYCERFFTLQHSQKARWINVSEISLHAAERRSATSGGSFGNEYAFLTLAIKWRATI